MEPPIATLLGTSVGGIERLDNQRDARRTGTRTGRSGYLADLPQQTPASDLTKTMERLGVLSGRTKDNADDAKLYEAIVECARRDFRHK